MRLFALTSEPITCHGSEMRFVVTQARTLSAADRTQTPASTAATLIHWAIQAPICLP